MDKKDIRKLKPNPDNPRTMSEFMEGKLIESLLVFPKMLELRPILVNQEDVIVGGNGRVQCLNKILELDDNEIEDYMFNQKKFRMASDEEKTALLAFWAKWKKNQQYSFAYSTMFQPRKRRKFVKDNLHYGEDDIEIMKRHFEREAIGDYLGYVAWNLYDYDDKDQRQKSRPDKDLPRKVQMRICGMSDDRPGV